MSIDVVLAARSAARPPIAARRSPAFVAVAAAAVGVVATAAEAAFRSRDGGVRADAAVALQGAHRVGRLQRVREVEVARRVPLV